MKINELRISLAVVQSTLESMIHQQAKLLSQEVLSSFNVDNIVSGWIEKVENRYGDFRVSVNKIDVALENMGHDADVFISLAEKLNIELLSVIDEITVENQKLIKNLELTQLKLRDAEQVRDDVCLLSSVEKGAWTDEKRICKRNLRVILVFLTQERRHRRHGMTLW